MTKSWQRLFSAIAENVGVPVGAYLLFTALGWQPVWSLVGAAGVSVLILAAQYLHRRELTVLGILVLARFALGAPAATPPSNPRLPAPLEGSNPAWRQKTRPRLIHDWLAVRGGTVWTIERSRRWAP